MRKRFPCWSLLQEIDPVAQEYGITIALEPLETAECNIINTFAEAVALAEAAGCPSVRVLADYYHMTREAEPPEVLTQYPNCLAHVHISCPYRQNLGVRTPPGYGDGWDYTPFFSALRAAGYDGRMSLEAYSTQPIAHGQAALAFLRQMVNEKKGVRQ